MDFLKHEGTVILGGVEELSKIVSDVPFIGAIGSLVCVVVEKALQAHANKEQCTRLALRAKIVWQALVPLVSSGSAIDAAHASAFVAALEQLASTLTSCRDLVQQFAETANWKRWLLSGKHHERFAELTAQLSEDQQALSLGLDVDAFAFREADKASAKSDLQQLEQVLLQMQREQAQNAERVVNVVRRTTKRAVAAVERAIDDTAHAQTDEIKHFIAAQLQQLQLASLAGHSAVVVRQDSLPASGSMPVPEISPCQVEIDDSCAVRVTSDDSGVVFEAKWMGENVSVKRLLPPEGSRLSPKIRRVSVARFKLAPRCVIREFCQFTARLSTSRAHCWSPSVPSSARSTRTPRATICRRPSVRSCARTSLWRSPTRTRVWCGIVRCARRRV
jgi:hypothetical protein